MSKVYLIFNGNEIIDVVVNNKECAENTYNWIVKNNDNDYKIYELLEFEVNDFREGVVNALCIYKLNGKPFAVIVNNEEFMIKCPNEDDDYRRYSYEVMFVEFDGGSYRVSR